MVIEIESVEVKGQLEETAKRIALAIMHRDFAQITQALVDFAEEIKREAIEP